MGDGVGDVRSLSIYNRHGVTSRMAATMRAYQATAPEHMMVVPDHYPRIPGDTQWGHQSRAYAIGYIKALIRAAGGETP